MLKFVIINLNLVSFEIKCNATKNQGCGVGAGVVRSRRFWVESESDS